MFYATLKFFHEMAIRPQLSSDLAQHNTHDTCWVGPSA
jgi:hypothetical protein